MEKFRKSNGEIVEIRSKKAALRNDNIIHLDTDGNEILNEDGTPMERVYDKGGFNNITVLGDKRKMEEKNREFLKKRSEKFIKENPEIKLKNGK